MEQRGCHLMQKQATPPHLSKNTGMVLEPMQSYGRTVQENQLSTENLSRGQSTPQNKALCGRDTSSKADK